MTINNNSVEQINVALLDIDKRLKMSGQSAKIDKLSDDVANITRSMRETRAGLQSGETYNINITGNAATATRATIAETANTAETAESANTALSANHANTAETAESAETAEKATKDGDGNVISSTYVKVSALVNAVYPVNTVYESIVDVNPSTYFTGTTWVQIQTTPTFKWKRTV